MKNSLAGIAIIGMVLSAGLVSGQRPALAQSYSVVDVGRLAGMDYSYPVAIIGGDTTNPTIRIIGNNVQGGSKKHPFYWDSAAHTIRDIGLLGVGSYGIPYAVNNLGEVVGTSATTSTGGNNHPIYWNPSRGAAPLDLANTVGSALSINDSGVIVGSIASASVGGSGVYWTRTSGLPGATTTYSAPIPLPGGDGATGVYISPAGDIAATQTIGSTNYAVVWKNKGTPSSPAYSANTLDGSFFVIQPSADFPVTLMSVRFGKTTADGKLLVTGYWENGTAASGSWLWREGDGITPTYATSTGGDVQVLGMNDLGWASGHVRVPLPTGSYTFHGYALTDTGSYDLGTLGGSQSRAYGAHNNGFGYTINHSGLVVGYSLTTSDAAAHAFRWSSLLGMQDLNATTLTPSKGPFSVLSDAAGITDSGHITGTGTLPKVKGNIFSNTYLLIPK